MSLGADAAVHVCDSINALVLGLLLSDVRGD